jgi:hypothetical protein
MSIDNPKSYFQCKNRILEFAMGLDCHVKFDDKDRKSKLIIFSNSYKLEKDRRPSNLIEQDRFSRVQNLKERILTLINEVDKNNSVSFIKILDEETRAQCRSR